MRHSENCRKLVAEFEGCFLQSYLCPADKPTIGFGHTKGVKLGQTITREEAERLLDEDLGNFAAAVRRALKRQVNQNQFDALVSFAFNCKRWQGSTLLKLVNAGAFDAAATEFGKWIYAKGVVLRGLARRRAAEETLFRSPVKGI